MTSDPLRAAEEALTPKSLSGSGWKHSCCQIADAARREGYEYGLAQARKALAAIRAARAEPHIIDMGVAKADATMFDMEIDGARAAVPADREALAQRIFDHARRLDPDCNDRLLVTDLWLAAAIIHTPAAEEVEAMARRLMAFADANLANEEADLVTEAVALLRRSAAPSAEWRTIETAPKDGTRIQLMCLKMPKFYTLPDILWIKVGSWRKHWQDGYEAGWREDALTMGGDTGRVKITPTHWQSLPAAPSSAQAGEDVG